MLLLAIATFAAAVAARSLPHDTSPLAPKHASALPSKFSWISSDSLVGPKNDSRGIAGIKDPSIIYYNDVYHVFASTAKEEGYNLVYFNFTDFSKAGKAPFYYLDQSAIGTGYRAAPEVCKWALWTDPSQI
jgi:hypothetical protein